MASMTIPPKENIEPTEPEVDATTPAPTEPEEPRGKKAKKKEEEPVSNPDEVVFISAEDEPKQFDIGGVRGIRDETGKKVVWRVPVDRADRFARHSFVLTGRVVRA